MLYDRVRANCYLLGPTLVTGADVDSATVVYDAPTSSWAVKVHFKNDAFLTKIAHPLVNKRVAVVLAGFVQSVLTDQAGGSRNQTSRSSAASPKWARRTSPRPSWASRPRTCRSNRRAASRADPARRIAAAPTSAATTIAPATIAIAISSVARAPSSRRGRPERPRPRPSTA